MIAAAVLAVICCRHLSNEARGDLERFAIVSEPKTFDMSVCSYPLRLGRRSNFFDAHGCCWTGLIHKSVVVSGPTAIALTASTDLQTVAVTMRVLLGAHQSARSRQRPANTNDQLKAASWSAAKHNRCFAAHRVTLERCDALLVKT